MPTWCKLESFVTNKLFWNKKAHHTGPWKNSWLIFKLMIDIERPISLCTRPPLVPNSAWLWRGLCDTVLTPGPEPAGHGPSHMLAVARSKACLYNNVHIAMLLHQVIFSMLRLVTPWQGVSLGCECLPQKNGKCYDLQDNPSRKNLEIMSSRMYNFPATHTIRMQYELEEGLHRPKRTKAAAPMSMPVRNIQQQANFWVQGQPGTEQI